MFQSRRSLLIWKIFGQRLDGWSNDDFPTETVPGDPTYAAATRASRSPNTPQNRNRVDLDYTGSIMPPPEAVAGTYVGPGRQEDQGRAADRRGPADPGPLDRPGLPDRPGLRPRRPQGPRRFRRRAVVHLAARGGGRRPGLDAGRPAPDAGRHPPARRAQRGPLAHPGGHVGLLERPRRGQLPRDGRFCRGRGRRGQEPGGRFRQKSAGVWELTLATPIKDLPAGELKVSIKDHQGNTTEIKPTFSAGASLGRTR